jgi:hypothetical protein
MLGAGLRRAACTRNQRREIKTKGTSRDEDSEASCSSRHTGIGDRGIRPAACERRRRRWWRGRRRRRWWRRRRRRRWSRRRRGSRWRSRRRGGGRRSRRWRRCVRCGCGTCWRGWHGPRRFGPWQFGIGLDPGTRDASGVLKPARAWRTSRRVRLQPGARDASGVLKPARAWRASRRIELQPNTRAASVVLEPVFARHASWHASRRVERQPGTRDASSDSGSSFPRRRSRSVELRFEQVACRDRRHGRTCSGHPRLMPAADSVSKYPA